MKTGERDIAYKYKTVNLSWILIEQRRDEIGKKLERKELERGKQ